MLVPLVDAMPGKRKRRKGAALAVCVLFLQNNRGSSSLFFLTAVHFEIPGCIPETRLSYSENKVQKRGTERGPEGKQLCGRGDQEEPAGKEKITTLSS